MANATSVELQNIVKRLQQTQRHIQKANGELFDLVSIIISADKQQELRFDDGKKGEKVSGNSK